MRRTVWFLVPLLFLSVCPASVPAGEEGKDPGEGKVELPPFFLAETKGKVDLVTWDAGKKKAVKRKAKAPMAVGVNDRIMTGKKSRAYLQFKDGGTVEVGPESEVFVREIDATPRTFRARFLLAFGRFRAVVKKLASSSSTFEVEAGGVVAGVRGTTFEVEYDGDKEQAVTRTYEGKVYTRVGKKEQWVKEGFSLAFTGGKDPVSAALTVDDLKDFVEFIDVSGDLEKKKAILLEQLEKQLLKKVTGGLIEKGKEGKKAVRFGF